MIYTISPKVYFQVCEEDDKKEYVQMDQIMKRLFTLKNKKPIIDFLNAAYRDELSYDAKISYSNTEIINTKNLSAQYVAFHADIFITAEEGNNIFEYAIEFQTAFDKDIAIRMFRYSFERAVRLDYYREKNMIVLNLPEPYIILLEEEKGLADDLTLEIRIPKRDIISFSVNIMKYWEYDLNRLYEENKYLLYPIQVFNLRKAMEKANNEDERKELYSQMKITIAGTFKAIDKAYKDGKIEIEDYDEMTTVLVNLNSYLVNVYNLEGEVEKEIDNMVKMIKSFYDPEVEKKGIEKGIGKGAILAAKAVNMIIDGDSNEKIKKSTGLDESVIVELRKSIEPKGEH